MLNVIILSVLMLHVIILNVIMLNVIILCVIKLNVVILSVIMLNVVIISVIKLNVIILSAIILNVILLNVIILNVVILSVVLTLSSKLLNVVIPECHYTESRGTLSLAQSTLVTCAVICFAHGQAGVRVIKHFKQPLKPWINKLKRFSRQDFHPSG